MTIAVDLGRKATKQTNYYTVKPVLLAATQKENPKIGFQDRLLLM